MKSQKTSHELIRQNEKNVKKPQKHDANLQKNTTLYFQIGLILCLLATYGVMEMRFLSKPMDLGHTIEFIDEPTDIVMNEFTVYVEPKTPEPMVQQKNPPKHNWEEPKVTDNDSDLKEATDNVIKKEVPKTNTNPNPEIKDPEKPVDIAPVPFAIIEQVPIFPGCEGESTNDAKRKCMSEKINKLIQRKFNTDIAIENGLKGLQRISVRFTIDQTGNVTNILTRAPHPALEKEAQRVVDKLPKMTPGKQRDQKVSVIYDLPITFKVYD